jgi:flagellar basal body-associated protein FliL
MLEKNTFIIIGCVIILLLLGVNLYFNWKCNKDTDDNEQFLGINFKNFRKNLNIFSVLIILIMWFCCIILFTSKKICICSQEQIQARAQTQALEPAQMQVTTTESYNL